MNNETKDKAPAPSPSAGLDLQALENFIFDLDGVIWRGNTAIEGAVESVGRLRAAGKRCFYCTNNSGRTQRDFATRLRGIGLELDEQEVITSSSATAIYLSEQFPSPFTAYVIGGEGIVTALQDIGAHVLTVEEAAANPPHVHCVVVGIDRAFTYDKMRLAQQFILQGARFIATNQDATFPTEDGVVPGAGAVVAGIATASGVTPLTIGKPEPTMLHLALKKFGLAAATTVMVGDRLDTDIACAHRAGLVALLVLTGITTRDEAQAAAGEANPDAIYADLPALCQAVLKG